MYGNTQGHQQMFIQNHKKVLQSKADTAINALQFALEVCSEERARPSMTVYG